MNINKYSSINNNVIQAAGAAAQACHAAATSTNRGGSDEEDATQEDAEEIQDQFPSSKNSISPPASSFDSTHSGTFPTPANNNINNGGNKHRDVHGNQHQHGPNLLQLDHTTAPTASLTLW